MQVALLHVLGQFQIARGVPVLRRAEQTGQTLRRQAARGMLRQHRAHPVTVGVAWGAASVWRCMGRPSGPRIADGGIRRLRDGSGSGHGPARLVIIVAGAQGVALGIG
ncbi:hypothetical protein D3093_30100 (plasmid) [Azospirillum argentinense]|uniref:Uncharacterized protein n=1 Tax=Azospirillum argentinense TaxID=2970906 RepID=A0A4D8PN07_9PROT|nr:hypothetical protein D3093_30100 [Azospirillum argentinense]